jgi:adenylyltransferase/sulfurtransferase
VIIDATDNYETRYIINDSCIILDKPMVYGAIYKYEGQISVFNYKGGPTYRCFNPDDHGKILKNPQPADIGLMGVLPGITGTWMANEVIKIITGIGTVLSGKVLVFNTMDNSFRLLSIRNIPENHSISSITTSFLSGR